MPAHFFPSIESLAEAIRRVRSSLELDGHISAGSLSVMVSVTREGFYLSRVPAPVSVDCGCLSSYPSASQTEDRK